MYILSTSYKSTFISCLVFIVQALLKLRLDGITKRDPAELSTILQSYLDLHESSKHGEECYVETEIPVNGENMCLLFFYWDFWYCNTNKDTGTLFIYIIR